MPMAQFLSTLDSEIDQPSDQVVPAEQLLPETGFQVFEIRKMWLATYEISSLISAHFLAVSVKSH